MGRELAFPVPSRVRDPPTAAGTKGERTGDAPEDGTPHPSLCPEPRWDPCRGCRTQTFLAHSGDCCPRPRRPARTTDRDRGRPAHAAHAPPRSAPTPGTKGRVPSRGGLFIPTKRHGPAPPDSNRLLSGKAQRLSSARRPPSAPADNAADRVFVRRGTQSPPSPAGSKKTAVRLMQLGAESLIPANLKIRVYLLKVIPSPLTSAVRVRPLGYSPQGDASGAGRARSRRELCGWASPGRDAHAILRGRGAVPQFQRLPSPRCKHFQQLSSAGMLP
ncbi:uncharacterized protein LOC143692232 [Agelaius phoeniceus]|uniref:uncharacterized protein LOC143692232 n=1 Tax=Agelaius phoeniceus TaxID=39638 RepID=UPI0040550DE4